MDVTSPLLNWIAASPNGSTLQFAAGACYRIEGTLEFRARSGLTLDGNGATFRSFNAPEPQRSIWRVIDSSGITFRNMTIRGSYPNGGTHDVSMQNAHAIDVRGTSVEIVNVTASDMAGDCVYLGLGYSSAQTRSTGSVHDVNCSRTGRNGVSVTAGDDIRIERVTTNQIGFVAFDIEPNKIAGFGSKRVVVTNNTIGSYYLYAWAVIDNADVSDQSFTNNTIVASKGLRIAAPDYNGYRPARLTVAGNTAQYATGSGAMEMEGLDGLTITSNVVPLTGGTMATISGSCTVNVSGNTYTGGSTEAQITSTPTSCAPPPAPTINSFSPTSGAIGTAVTLTGSALTGASKVTFNGVSASFAVDSDSKITTSVPSGATSGKIAVVTPAGTTTSASSFTVTTSPLATSCAKGQFQASYYAGSTLTGMPVLTRCEAGIDYDWGSGSPSLKVPTNDFSARWTGTFDFPAGQTTFEALADDGLRVWVDGYLLIDAWLDQPKTLYTARRSLAAGKHEVKVEYYENAGLAVAELDWNPTTSSCPSGRFAGEYFATRDLSGPVVSSSCDVGIDYNWGSGSPASVVPPDDFSARWTGAFEFEAGTTTFSVTADDGFRLWVDGVLLVDAWIDQPATTYTTARKLSAGEHVLKIEYYENGGQAVAKLSWGTETGSAEPAPVTCPDAYRVDYFANLAVGGQPVLSRCEQSIEHDWASGGPGTPVPSDNFSARWSGTFTFPAGNATFNAVSDDGVRVWVDGTLLIDAWNDHAATSYTATRSLTAGSHDVRMEYYENGGQAVAKLSWIADSTSSATTTSTPDSTTDSTTISATTPAADVPSSCESNSFLAKYFANESLDGDPALARCESGVGGEWGSEGPGAPIPVDGFSAHWEGTVEFDGGKTVFTVTADDGIRLWVDDDLLVDAWKTQPATTYAAVTNLRKGDHRVVVEYYEADGEAVALVSWSR